MQKADVTPGWIDLGAAAGVEGHGPWFWKHRPAFEHGLVAQKPQHLRPGAIPDSIEQLVSHPHTVPMRGSWVQRVLSLIQRRPTPAPAEIIVMHVGD